MPPSRASPLPQWAMVFIEFMYAVNPCGSGLARDGATSFTA
jgi:hypothetical protein